MTPVDAVRERLAAYFRGQEADVLAGPEALAEARRLLTGALRVRDDDEVALEEDLLALVALFFWSRWIEAPTDFEDPDCQTAYRLYAVLRAVDPEATVPPQLDEPLADAEPVPELLHQESRDLVDGCLQEFDDIAVELGIGLGRCAVALAERDTAERAEYSCNLGAGLFARYRHHADESDLDEAIMLFAATDGLGGDEEQARYQANLGVAWHTRFQRGGRPEDLAGAVAAHRRALRHQPDTARYRSQYAAVLHTRYETGGRRRDLRRAIRHADGDEPQQRTNLALMLRDRFEALGDPADLHRSITLLEAVVEGTGPGDPDRARRLAALAAGLNMRFTITGDVEDLDTAVALDREAVRTARPSDPHRPSYRSNLGHALHNRFDERGDPADLEAAVAAHAEAQQRGDPLRAGNAANALAARFDQLSDIADLDRALRVYLESVDGLPEGSIHRGGQLSNLGGLWFDRFQRTHDLDDLQRAIAVHEASLRCTPRRHLDRSRRLVNLATALDSRHERTGDFADLDRAVELHRRAYAIAPAARAGHHASALAIALHLRFHLRGGDGDLGECIALLRVAVDCRADHPDRPRRLSVLASALITRFRDRGNPADIAEAAAIMRQSLAATPERHVQRVGREVMLGSALAKSGDAALVAEAVDILRAAARAREASSSPGYRLRTLGDGLLELWELSGSAADLEAAVGAYRDAVAATDDADPDQALNRYDLANALAALADATGDTNRRRESVKQYAAAAGQVTAAALVRIHAAGEWAAQAVELADAPGAVEAYAAAVDLLPRLAWVGLERRDQERALAGWSALAADAAAAALATADRDRAVELGDQGRSLLWEQRLHLRRDHRDLARRRPRLTARLDRVRRELLSAATGITRPPGRTTADVRPEPGGALHPGGTGPV
ncbi:hypothetical protein [Dactylosporangium sp. NPDC051541]|uniref:hypothetical protein n=1 Tax=Dactylosporangium sp. NPDC051541 TaxID=3363977 RepID=UPI00378776EB